MFSHLEDLTDAYNWEAYGTMSVADAVAAMATMYGDFRMGTIVNDTGPRLGVFPMRAWTDGNQDIVFNVDTGQINNGVWNWAVVADGQWLEWDFDLAQPGSVLFYVHYQKRSGAGKIDFKMDGGVFGVLDQYASATAKNQIFVWSADSLSAGHHTMRMQGNGKNASSSGYQINISEIDYRVDV